MSNTIITVDNVSKRYLNSDYVLRIIEKQFIDYGRKKGVISKGVE